MHDNHSIAQNVPTNVQVCMPSGEVGDMNHTTIHIGSKTYDLMDLEPRLLARATNGMLDAINLMVELEPNRAAARDVAIAEPFVTACHLHMIKGSMSYCPTHERVYVTWCGD